MPEIRFNSILTPPVQAAQNQSTSVKNSTPSVPFSDVLNDAISGTDEVRFSKHALTRLESRDIELDGSDLKKLSGAVDEAQSKGVSDSLILMNGLAFIVSVKDRTVVTAMPVSETSSNVFTNIDGAVIA